MPTINCPTCESLLEVDQSSIGQIVECGSCKAQFPAKIPEEAKPDAPTTRLSKQNPSEDPDDPFREDQRRTPKPGQGLGLASLILGIVGLFLSLLCCIHPVMCGSFTVIVDILAIIFGAITASTDTSGKGRNGMIMGICAIVAKVLLTFIWFVVIYLMSQK